MINETLLNYGFREIEEEGAYDENDNIDTIIV